MLDSECVINTLRSLSNVGSVQLARLWLTCSTSAALSSQIRCGLSIWIQASQKGREYGIPFCFHVMGESLRFFPLRVNLVWLRMVYIYTYCILFTNELIHIYHISMQKLLETTYQNIKHTFLKNLWFLFTMYTEKAKLISCFGNDYCIPTTLFKTISKLNIKTIFSTCTKIELSKLWSCFFQTAPIKRKKVRYDPLCFIVSLCLSLCLSLRLLSVLLSNVSYVRMYYLFFILS